MHTVSPDIDKDTRKVKKKLRALKKDELKNIFEELGLFRSTLENKYGDDIIVYADDLICAWILGRDDVLTSDDYPGGPTWENLIRALREFGHNGVANDIGEN